jgi:hypothetical protein
MYQHRVTGLNLSKVEQGVTSSHKSEGKRRGGSVT